MRAHAVIKHGLPGEVFQQINIPIPVLQEDEVLVNVFYTSINPLDCRIRSTSSVPRKFPLILGFDVCGEVVELGKSVTGITPGDIIIGSPNVFRAGANAEYVAMNHKICLPVGKMNYQDGAAIPLAGITAYEALFDRLKIQRGDQILIHAGAGGVGHLAIQLAKHAGCEVITTAGRDESIEFCKSLSADQVINYRADSFAEKILIHTSGKGIAKILDTVGDKTFLDSLSCLQAGGTICTILPVSFDTATGYSNLLKNITICYAFMGAQATYGIEPYKQRQVLAKLMELYNSGNLKPHISKVFELEHLAEAHEEMEKGRTIGKMVIAVQEQS